MKWWLLPAVAALTTSCGSFGKPALPKFATGAAPRATAQEQGTAPRRNVDVIYFGLTKGADPAAASRILETLRGSGQRVALGWSQVPAAQQPLLDRWQAEEISTAQLLAQLDLRGRSEGLRGSLRPDLAPVALGPAREVLRKLRAGDPLSPVEQASLPAGYRTRPEAFDDFADRVASSPRLRHDNVAALYRAHLVAEQTIAENIVRFRRAHPESKLLVFLPNDMMIDPREVAEYVAQKQNVRQMILDRAGAPPEKRPQLLARLGAGHMLEVVDRAPETARHHRRPSLPWLRA